MADKFPALDSIEDSLPTDGEGDFLSREKELVGDEFQTEQDQEILKGSDDEINDFKEQFPEVDSQEQPEPVQQVQEDEEEFEEFTSQSFQGESKHLKEWQERRNLEIEQREKVNEKKKQEIITKAQSTIDDFYDNYNNKRETHTKDILKEEEEFLAKRDGFLNNGTLWDRVNQLTSEVGEYGERDKSRFKGLLEKLKGKENVPGAGGYQT